MALGGKLLAQGHHPNGGEDGVERIAQVMAEDAEDPLFERVARFRVPTRILLAFHSRQKLLFEVVEIAQASPSSSSSFCVVRPRCRACARAVRSAISRRRWLSLARPRKRSVG